MVMLTVMVIKMMPIEWEMGDMMIMIKKLLVILTFLFMSVG